MAKPVIEMIRLPNTIMIGLAVAIGYIIASPKELDPTTLTLGMITGMAINAAIMIINDIADIEIDRINRPNRPLVRGDITVGAAKTYALGFLAIGILTSGATGLTTLIIATAFALLGIIYNYYLKGLPLIGNLAVSGSVAIPFIYGALLTGDPVPNINVVLLSIAAFTVNTYREIIKDIADIEGDKHVGLKTLPIVTSPRTSYIISIVFLVIGIFTGLVPLYIDTGLNRTIYIPLIIITTILLVISMILARKVYEEEQLIRAKRIALLGMFMGMMSFLVSSLI